MTTETLERIFKQLFSSNILKAGASLVWHAGEPLAVPIDFYEEALSICDAANSARLPVSHAIQTNGTLLNERWCSFLKKANIKVGVSVDGPKKFHDIHRVDIHGSGTFDKTMRGIRLLQESNIDFHIIMVLTRQSLLCPNEIWSFIEQYKICDVCFNVEEVEGIHRNSSVQTDDAVALYENFLEYIIEKWEAEGRARYVREFDALLGHILRRSEPRSTENTPFSILNFDYKGNVSTFSPELLGMEHVRYGNFVLGNVHLEKMEDIASHSRLGLCWEDIYKGVMKCKETCEYFSICGGGAPSNKLFENGTFDSTETVACKMRRKSVTNVVLRYLESKLEEFEGDTQLRCASEPFVI